MALPYKGVLLEPKSHLVFNAAASKQDFIAPGGVTGVGSAAIAAGPDVVRRERVVGPVRSMSLTQRVPSALRPLFVNTRRGRHMSAG